MTRGRRTVMSMVLVAALWAGVGPLAAPSSIAQAAELLMFEEPGCPWCRRWHAEVGPGYARSSEGKRAPLRTVQIDAQPIAGIRLASPVRLSPTFVLVEDGREVGRILGYPGADFFWPMLEDLLAKLKPQASLGSGPPHLTLQTRIEGVVQ